MEPGNPDVVVPTEPGLHLLVDRPQGPGSPVMMALAVHALSSGMPVVPILLDRAAPQFRAELLRHGVDAAAAEEAGLLSYVDAHALRVGWAHTTPATVFVEDQGPDAILLGLGEAQAGVVESAPTHMVLVDSLSTLLVLEGLPATYALAQALSSLAPRVGAITVARVVAGMHVDREVVSLAHLAATVTDLTGEVPARSEVREPGKEWRR